MSSRSKSPGYIIRPNATVENPPLLLIEASGPAGWLISRGYVPAGTRTPPFKLMLDRAYDGDFPTRRVGKHRCIDPHNVPLLLKTFDLLPEEEHVAA